MMAEISVSLQDGESKSFPQGAIAAEILKELVSGKQRKQTLAVKCNGKMVDLSTPLTEDTIIEPISVQSAEGAEILRHSTAHIMALAVKELFGDQVKVAIGPAIEDGFYYDFDREKPFSPDDFEQIENKMTEIANARLPFHRQEMGKEEAIRFFEQLGEIYKVELLQDMEAETVSLYTHGTFVDLCRGPHVPDSSWIKVFKLLRVAGSYWRGDEKRQMLNRIYWTAFADKKELQQYLTRLEEARKRDHRKLGKQLGLFTIQDQIGPGLILWQPRGAQLRRLIEDYWKDEHYCNG